jgi:hypothetical protein
VSAWNREILGLMSHLFEINTDCEAIFVEKETLPWSFLPVIRFYIFIHYYKINIPIQGVSKGIVNILGGGSMDYSE